MFVAAVAPISLTGKGFFHPPPPRLSVRVSTSVRLGILCSAGWLLDNVPVSALRIILITAFPIVHMKRIATFLKLRSIEAIFEKAFANRVSI